MLPAYIICEKPDVFLGRECVAAGGGRREMKQLIGLAALFIAVGMLLMLFLSSRLLGLIIIAVLLFAGYSCLNCD